MVFCSSKELKVGQVLQPNDGSGYKGCFNLAGEQHAVPIMILRVATKEEYLAQYVEASLSMRWRADMDARNNPFYYEISVD